MEIAGYLAFEWVCGAMHLKFHHLILDWGVKGFTRKKQIRISQYTGLWGFMQKQPHSQTTWSADEAWSGNEAMEILRGLGMWVRILA